MVPTIRAFMKLPPALLLSQIHGLNRMVDDLFTSSKSYDDFMEASVSYRRLAFASDIAYSMVLPFESASAAADDVVVLETLSLPDFKSNAVSLVLHGIAADYRYAYRSDSDAVVVTDLSVNPHGVALGFVRDDFPLVARVASKD